MTDKIVDFTQTVGIIMSILFAFLYQRSVNRQNSATFMVTMADKFHSDRGSLIFVQLDEYGNLDKLNSAPETDMAIECFLQDYEMLAIIYQDRLINRTAFTDAFGYELVHALKDLKVKAYIKASKNESPSAWDAVLKLNQQFGG